MESRDVDIRAQCSRLGKGIRFGKNIKITAQKLRIDDDVFIGDDTKIVGKEVAICRRVSIGNNAQIRVLFGTIHECAVFSTNFSCCVPNELIIGKFSRFEDNSSVDVKNFRCGSHCYFGSGFNVGLGASFESGSEVIIGSRTQFGPYCILNPSESIQIGSDVGCGAYVSFWTHAYHSAHSIILGYSSKFSGITIGDRTWLGYHTSVLPGIEIGEDAIVAAGSIVISDIPTQSLAAGVPAKIKKRLIHTKLTKNELRLKISEIMDKWIASLQYKRVKIKNIKQDSWDMMLPLPDSKKIQVEILMHLSKQDVEKYQHPSIVVAMSVDKDIEIGRSLTVIDAENQRILGKCNIIASDLRNFLRRSSLYLEHDSHFGGLSISGLTQINSIERAAKRWVPLNL